MLTGAQTIAGNAVCLYVSPYVISYSIGTQWPKVSFVFLFVLTLEHGPALPLFGASPINHLIDLYQMQAHWRTVNAYSIGLTLLGFY
jgi:hypothetical protein